jgi:fatty acid desaturase
MALLALIINPISRGYEHYPLAEMRRDAEERRDLRRNTVTITSPLLGLLWANITYHLEHHLYPRVPFFKLPAVHRLLEGKDYVIEPYPLYRVLRAGQPSSDIQTVERC